jgi:hypothetical protein
MYYFVQFPDDHYFIYRSSENLNLWTFNQRLMKSLPFYSNGLPVVITNEGDHLTPYTEAGKFVVRVKTSLPYFSEEEKKKRVTVFERDYNITHVFFEIPLDRESQSSATVCWTRRTIFTLPHPFPYIMNRVQVSKEDISVIVFSPIERACQELAAQCSAIEGLIKGKDCKSLTGKLWGSLVPTVNEGPGIHAKSFLGPLSPDHEHQPTLRAVYRKLLALYAHGLELLKNATGGDAGSPQMLEVMEKNFYSLSSSLQLFLS